MPRRAQSGLLSCWASAACCPALLLPCRPAGRDASAQQRKETLESFGFISPMSLGILTPPWSLPIRAVQQFGNSHIHTTKNIFFDKGHHGVHAHERYTYKGLNARGGRAPVHAPLEPPDTVHTYILIRFQREIFFISHPYQSR
jgi:hypothetical protein